MQTVNGYIYGANATSEEFYSFEYTKQVSIEGIEMKENDYAVYHLEKDWFEDEFMSDGIHDMVVFCDEIRAKYILREEKILVPVDAEHVIFKKENGTECEIDIKEVFENTLESYFKEADECRIHSFVCKEGRMHQGKIIEYKEDTVVTKNENILSFLEIEGIHVLVDGKIERIYSGLHLSDDE